MTGAIHFFTEDIHYNVRNKKKIKDWIDRACENEKFTPGAINFILCSDKYLLAINRKYLNRSYLTDIITFPMMENDKIISGDIFISLERVRENAKKYCQKTENELHRIIIHGILHLAGYNDSTEEQKKMMTEKEDFYLSRFSLS
jgi:probable rRNA maturation factor